MLVGVNAHITVVHVWKIKDSAPESGFFESSREMELSVRSGLVAVTHEARPALLPVNSAA